MARITKQQRILDAVINLAARSRIHGEARLKAWDSLRDSESGVHCAHVALYEARNASFFARLAREAQEDVESLVKGSK